MHPDFSPFDVVDVDHPPFQITKYGWGECPVRLQIHFHDFKRNSPINIIHVLKLDPLKGGRTVIGSRRRLEIDLDRDTEFVVSNQQKSLTFLNFSIT